jgi:hypothetical protein
VQLVQESAALPQAASVRPSWHTPFASQQPLGHVSELHPGMNAQ